MSRKWIAVVFLAACGWMGSALAEEGDFAALQGTWKGPWYIGMSSGQASMQIRADGSGEIDVTNLEGFGEQPAALTKTAFDGKVFKFTAAGAGNKTLSMSLQLATDGQQLRGNGKYGGFGARLELRRE